MPPQRQAQRDDRAGEPIPALRSAAIPGDGETADRLSGLLAGAADYLDALWPDRPGHGARLRELRSRLIRQTLQIAVLGQFKRGKSTFLNALLGQPALPTGVVPLTAIPTFIRWGEQPSLRVSYQDGRSPREFGPGNADELSAELFRLVTEEGNPHNREKIARVDVALPAAILDHGIVLIDTPGIGSTHQHNTDAALAVLPECDAAFIVLSVDPPVTAAELDYLDCVAPHVARLFFVLNKIDYVAGPERAQATEFLRRTLREHRPDASDVRIFTVSARNALEAKATGDTDRLNASGLPAVESYLGDFLAGEKTAALRDAIVAKAIGALKASEMDVALAIRALEMPIAELETRAAQFADIMPEVGRQRQEAQDLVAGDRRRALADLETQAEALRREARTALRTLLDKETEAVSDPDRIEAAAKTAIAAAIPEFFGPKLENVSRTFSRAIEQTLGRHVEAAERLVGSVRARAAALFDIPAIPATGADVFEISRNPFWVTQKWDQTVGSLAAGALDHLLPRSVRASRLRSRLAAEIDELAQRNVENLRWATLQNVDQAFRRFASWFDARLAEATAATQGAIDAALRRRRGHERASEHELGRLREAADRIAATQREIAQIQGGKAGRRASLPAPKQWHEV